MANESAQAQRSSQSQPVFLVGIFRSGTSLLYALLNQHPQIALMFECNVLDFPELLSKRRFAGNWLERQEFYNKALSRHRLIYANRLSGLEGVRTPEDLYRAYGDGKRAMLVGEKSPPYCLRLRQLARRYPEASFIIIWRDPLETYRSIRDAGRKVLFFNRIGVSRFVFYQEQMVRQAAELEFAGNRMHHVGYSDLVDRPEETCRNICQFLNIGFDPAMLHLANADLSAIYQEDQHQVHEQLMSGVIERRKYTENGLNPEIIEKLQRFHARWRRLGGKRLPDSASGVEPSLGERLYHCAIGRILSLVDSAKRLLFEFLPLTWLKGYRRTKRWFWKGNEAGSGSLVQEFLACRPIILMSCLILTLVVTLDLVTPPQMILLPFYLLPSSILALTVSRRWGSLAAVVSAPVWTAAKIPELASWNPPIGLLLWNCAMRFLALQFLVLLLSRIRQEIVSADLD